MVGLLHDAIGHRLVDRQGVEGGAVVGLEALFVGDGVELVEAQAVVFAEIHGLLGDGLQDLAAGEIADVAGVVVAHQQLGRLLGDLVDAGHILLGRRRGLHAVAPAVTEIEGQVLLEGLAAVEFGEAHRSHHRMAGGPQPADLLLHRRVHEVEVGHQGAVAGLVHHALEEAAHEACVLGHRVRLLGAFTQLGSEGDGHGQARAQREREAKLGAVSAPAPSRLRRITPRTTGHWSGT